MEYRKLTLCIFFMLFFHKAFGNVVLDKTSMIFEQHLYSLRSQFDTIEAPFVVEYLETIRDQLIEHDDDYLLKQYFDKQFLQIVIIASMDKQAFILPSGIIAISTGILQLAESRDEVAAIVAHELNHFKQQHFKRSADSLKRQTVVAIGSILLSAAMMSHNREIGLASLLGSQILIKQYALHQSREYEQEADRLAIEWLHQAGFYPGAVADIFEKMKADHRHSALIESLSTHPLPRTRVLDSMHRTDLLIEQKKKNKIDHMIFKAVLQSHLPKKLHHVVDGKIMKKNQQQMALQHRLRDALIHKKLNQKAKRALIDTIQSQQPDALMLNFIKNDLLIESDDVQFEAALKDSYEATRHSYTAALQYVDYLMAHHQPEQAISILRSVSQLRRYDHVPWKKLSQVYKEHGEAYHAEVAWAEFLLRIGKFANSIAALKNAIRLSNGHFLRIEKVKSRIESIEMSQEYIQRLSVNNHRADFNNTTIAPAPPWFFDALLYAKTMGICFSQCAT